MKNVSEQIVQLKLTGAVVIDGIIARAGTIVEMVESEARDLLRRGKAEIHAILGDEGDDSDPNAGAGDASQEAAAQAAADAAEDATKKSGGGGAEKVVQSKRKGE